MKITRHTLPDFLVNACAAVWLLVSAVEGVIDEHGANYDRIEDGLCVGGDVARPPWGTKAVLNLCEKEDAYRPETPVYRWEAIPDSAPAPSLDWLRDMVEFIEANRKAGRATYVHCRNGVSRSGMVIIAYEMYTRGWSRDEALAFVRSRRDIIRPNRAFMERLVEWEHVVSGGSAGRAGRTCQARKNHRRDLTTGCPWLMFRTFYLPHRTPRPPCSFRRSTAFPRPSPSAAARPAAGPPTTPSAA